ncbi:MAG: ABC transporter permease subunit [Thermoactinospora sp.]|nr:ABC transporter permease subunit [Thermoactinospora sp.]
MNDLRTLGAKLLLVGVVNALAVYGLVATYAVRDWGIFVVLLVATAAVDYVYFSRRTLATRYLLPGMLFLLVFQIYVVVYTAYAGFTNVGDGHNLTREQALSHILAVSEKRVPGSPPYRVQVLAGPDGRLHLLATDPRGTTTLDGEPVSGAPAGHRVLRLRDLVSRQQEVLALRVPVEGGSIRTEDGSTGYIARPTLRYAGGQLTDTTTGTVYRATERGFFESDDGRALTPGWREFVGFDNYVRAFSDERLRAPLLSVFAWTFAFALLSVLTTFLLGLVLALALNKEGLRGRGVYRSLLVLPYAVPSFLSALVWTGMLNQSFGFINQGLLGGAEIAWLNDPTLAKVSVLLVNLWLGFPYMFLICTGALQAIPGEVVEAARIDGAGAWQLFRRVTLPLLLVSTGPLLVASFAFNFNNFTVIYFVTGGGPNVPEAPITLGSTDLLISMVYKVAFGGAGREWGFACAMSTIIFLIVAAISAASFRRTRALEETYS